MPEQEQHVIEELFFCSVNAGKGIEHKPVAENECKMMVIEPAGTVNTGDGDVLELIQRILSKADEMVGSGLWQKLKNMIKQ